MRPLTIGQTRGGYPLHAMALPIDPAPHELAMREELQAVSVHLGAMLEAHATLAEAAKASLSLGPSAVVLRARQARSEERQAAQRRLDCARECLDAHEEMGGDRRARRDYHRSLAFILWSVAQRLQACGGFGGRNTADAMHIAADRHAALSTAK